MAIETPPTIDDLPPVPDDTVYTTGDEFVPVADAYLGALPDFGDQIEAVASNVYNNAQEAEGFATTASDAADAAANAQTAAEGFRDESEGFKDDSQAILDSNTAIAAAVQSAAGLPSLTGNAGLALVVNETEDGVLWENAGGERLNFTKSFNANEERTYTLDGEANLPVVSVTKEVAQIGESNNQWGVDVGGYEQSSSNLVISGDISLYGDIFISNTTYDSVSFGVAAQDGTPVGMAFNNDGTKMYVLGGANKAVYQYTLSTSWNVGTASYDSVSFSVASQVSNLKGLCFSLDGTKMYVADGNEFIYQYTLSTAWNVGTASYDNINFSIASQDSSLDSIDFSLDGSKMFVMGNATDSVYQYTLSTAWNVGTASYDSISFDVSPVAGTNATIARLSDDGLTMLIYAATGSTIYQYTLSTAWDISTASYTSSNFDTTSQGTAIQAISFNNDETKMFIISPTNDTVFQYSTGLSYIDNQHIPAITNLDGKINTTFWTDINSMVASETLNGQTINYALSNDDRTTWQIGLTGNSPRNIVRNNAGTWEYNSDATYSGETWTAATVNTEFDALSEAMSAGVTIFMLGTASYDNVSFSVTSQDGAPRDLAFNTDGTKMFVLGGTNDTAYQYTLSTAWNVGTASYDNVSFSIASQDASPYSLAFNTDGTRMFVLGDSNDFVYQYTLSTPWNVGTASYDNVSFSVASQDASSRGLFFTPDGTKMYMLGNNSDSVHQYTLSTAWNVGTASYDNVSFSVTSQSGFPTELTFNNDGTKMFVLGGASDSVHQYTLSTAWNVGTASYDNVSFSIASQDASPYSLAFNTDGTRMFVAGVTNDTVYQYTTVGLANQMSSSQLQALTDAEQIVLGNELDLAVILFTDNSAVTPSFSGMTIDYDANIKNQVAIEGVDYEWWSYEDTDITIKALAANNLKGRVL